MTIKRESINKFLIFTFLCISGGASVLIKTWFLIFYSVLLSVFFLKEYNRRILHFIITSIVLIFVQYLIVYLFSSSAVNINNYIRLFFLLYISFITFILTKDRFWQNLERMIYGLVVLSLFLFAIQKINFNFINSIVAFIDGLLVNRSESVYSMIRESYHSMIVYTINVNKNYVTFIPTHRNCGFAFEPGYFTFFINLGFLLMYIFKGIKIKRVLVYIVALFSTLSTTGIISFLCVLAIIFFNSNSRIRLYTNIIILVIVLVFLSIDYGFDKVQRLMTERQTAEEIISGYDTYQGVTLGRFTSLQYYISYIKEHNFLFGSFGIDAYEGRKIGNPSGLSILIYSFGLIGSIFLLYNFYKSTKQITVDLKIKIPILFFLFNFIYLFSFPILNFPFFWLLCFYSKMKHGNKYVKNKIPYKIRQAAY